MPRYDASNAQCQVFTFKEGLLSKIAHDLKIDVTDFSLEVDTDAGSVRGDFSVESLRVRTAMKKGKENPSALSDGDKQKISEQIAADVLHAQRHPHVTFVSSSVTETGRGYRIEGELTLHGVAQGLVVDARLDGEAYSAEVRLHQPDYSITPYTAMMGTLKVQAGVVVKLRVPAR